MQKRRREKRSEGRRFGCGLSSRYSLHFPLFDLDISEVKIGLSRLVSFYGVEMVL